MTTIHPPRPAVDEAHLVAWTAGYLANTDTAYRDGYTAGHADGYAAGYLQVLRDIANGTLAQPEEVARHLIAVGREDTLATARGLAHLRRWRNHMEQKAAERRAVDGRTEYRGGPVAWDGEAA